MPRCWSGLVDVAPGEASTQAVTGALATKGVPIKVLTFAETLRSLGGIEQSSLAISRLISNGSGTSVSLIYGADGDMTAEWRSVCHSMLKLQQLRLPRRHPLMSLTRIVRSCLFALRERPDVLYCHSMHQLPLALQVGRFLQRPVVLHIRTAPSAPTRRNSRRLDSVCSAIAVSQSVANDWVETFPHLRTRTFVIYNGIDLQKFTPPDLMSRHRARSLLGLSSSKYVVTYVGRLSPEKGVSDFLQATARLRSSESALEIVLVGAADDSPSAYAQELHIMGGHARFFAPMANIDVVYQASDLVVVPSHSETFGRVAVEALACGILLSPRARAA